MDPYRDESVATDSKKNRLFELRLASDDVTTGAIPVTWCLNEEMLKALKEDGMESPQVVIITHPVEKYSVQKESRTVVPLTDLMAYVDFKTAGLNKIRAFIEDGRTSAVSTKYLARNERGSYMRDLFNYEDVRWGYGFPFNRDTEKYGPEWEASEIELDVPEGIFAPEPPEWEKQWVNHYYKNKVVDQCDYRRRRIVAYTVQFPAVFVVQVIRLLIIFLALLLGKRGTSLMPFLNPLSMTTGDAGSQLETRSVFIRYDVEEDNKVLNFLKTYCLVPLTPLLSIPLVLLLVFVPFASVVLGAGLVIATTLAMFLLIGTISLMVSRETRERFVNFFIKNKPWDEASNIKLLTCSNNSFTIDTLPSEKKTVKLRFQEVKSKVCRPFSR